MIQLICTLCCLCGRNAVRDSEEFLHLLVLLASWYGKSDEPALLYFHHFGGGSRGSIRGDEQNARSHNRSSDNGEDLLVLYELISSDLHTATARSREALTTSVFHPLCTNAALRLYLVTVRQ